MIDPQARAKLQNLQTTRTISEGIDKITQALVSQRPEPKTPANDLADELRNLQKVIGGGNLSESLRALQGSLESFDFKMDGDSMSLLKKTVTELTTKIAILAEIEAKIPTEIKMNFPKTFPITGTVDVGMVESLPPVRVENLSEVSKSLAMTINNLQIATMKAIERSKPQFPRSMNVENEVKIAEFSELLDGIEELKKGFNLLINKEAATVGFPDKTIPVEIQNWMIPQPVTNVSINPSRGEIRASAITVTTSLTPLPSIPLFDRRSMTIYNNGSVTVFMGGANVTSATGIPVPASTYGPSVDVGPRNIVYAVTASSTADVRVLEMSDLTEGGDS